MKQSLMTNVIQYYYGGSGGGSFDDPLTITQFPLGNFITGLIITGGNALYFFRLKQGGRIIFPIRSLGLSGTNIFNFYAVPFDGASGIATHVIDGLWIPINSSEPLTAEFADPGAAGSTIIIGVKIASEDDRSLTQDLLNQIANNTRPDTKIMDNSI